MKSTMEMNLEENPKSVEVQVYILSPLEKVWEVWTNPAYITKWYIAHEEWHTPLAEVDLVVGGQFRFQMVEKSEDGMVVDFTGTYTQILPLSQVDYRISDGRKVSTWFRHKLGITHVKQQFEPETHHPVKFQKVGWQNILDNFKLFVSSENGTAK